MRGDFGDSFFYHPNDKDYGSPDELGLDYKQVHFPTSDGLQLHGWFFRAAGQSRGTILHLHGNAGNITGHFQHVAWLPATGWNVLCFDYRGYGQSEGKMNRNGSIMDAHAALDYLLSREDAATKPIATIGQSLGGAIAIVLTAERREVCGVITDGAFDSYRRIASHHIRHNPALFAVGWWVPWLAMGDAYNAIDYVARISPRPILIIHGTRDRIVPVKMAQRLYEAAKDPKELWLVEDADHYAPLGEHADEAQPRILHFLEPCAKVGS